MQHESVAEAAQRHFGGVDAGVLIDQFVEPIRVRPMGKSSNVLEKPVLVAQQNFTCKFAAGDDAPKFSCVIALAETLEPALDRAVYRKKRTARDYRCAAGQSNLDRLSITASRESGLPKKCPCA